MPSLKKQLEKTRMETKESCLMNGRLAEALEERTKQVANLAHLLDDRTKQVAMVEEERDRFRGRINQLIEEHANQIAKRNYFRQTFFFFYIK